jgi:hypothetical protein
VFESEFQCILAVCKWPLQLIAAEGMAHRHDGNEALAKGRVGCLRVRLFCFDAVLGVACLTCF